MYCTSPPLLGLCPIARICGTPLVESRGTCRRVSLCPRVTSLFSSRLNNKYGALTWWHHADALTTFVRCSDLQL